MKNFSLILIILFAVNVSFSQVNQEQIGKIIFRSYTFNKEYSQTERNIAVALNDLINSSKIKNFPVVILDMHYNRVRNLETNISYDLVEVAYQTYLNEFIGAAGNIYNTKDAHLFINISLDKNHKEYAIKALEYAIKKINELITQEAKLRGRKETNKLTEPEKSDFVLYKSIF